MNIKIQKNYTLENVSHNDIKTIVEALEFYRKSFMYEEFNEELLKQLGDIIHIPIKVSGTNDQARDILRRLSPFDSLMIPDEIFPGCSIRGMSWFMMGKSKQLNISVWDSRVSFDHKEKARTAFFINRHCANLLMGFLSSKKSFSKTQDTYLDSNGKISYDKRFILKYNIKDKSLIISKDSSEIILSEIEQICLEEFLLSHLGDL